MTHAVMLQATRLGENCLNRRIQLPPIGIRGCLSLHGPVASMTAPCQIRPSPVPCSRNCIIVKPTPCQIPRKNCSTTARPVLTCAVADAGGTSTLSMEEQKSLDSFRTTVAGQEEEAAIEGAHALLVRAVMQRKEAPSHVLGSLLFLEREAMEHPLAADLLPQLAGAWRLVFSGPSKIQALSYIPVDEDLIIDSAQSCLRLESDLGPLQPKFRGKFTWRPSVNKMNFAFSEAEVLLFGRSVFKRQVGFNEKTYTFFWLRNGVACARSSGGTLTLLNRL